MTPEIDITALSGVKSLVAFDLDDTLAPEALFLRSGARHAARWIHDLYPAVDPRRIEDAVDLAICNRTNHYSAVEEVMRQYGLLSQADMKTVVREFRHHRPDPSIYRMAPSMIALLEAIRDAGSAIALVTDGRSITQRNKIEALRLGRFIHADDILISEETGHDKMHPDSFIKLMEMHPEAMDFHYVGDNPAKDFLHPARLGWKTHLADAFPLAVHRGLT